MDQNLIINQIFNGEDLTIEDSTFLFNKIMSGELDDIKITAILIGLKLKGEKIDEIIGAAKVMKEKSIISIQDMGAPRHRACMPMLEHPAS